MFKKYREEIIKIILEAVKKSKTPLAGRWVTIMGRRIFLKKGQKLDLKNGITSIKVSDKKSIKEKSKKKSGDDLLDAILNKKLVTKSKIEVPITPIKKFDTATKKDTIIKTISLTPENAKKYKAMIDFEISGMQEFSGLKDLVSKGKKLSGIDLISKFSTSIGTEGSEGVYDNSNNKIHLAVGTNKTPKDIKEDIPTIGAQKIGSYVTNSFTVGSNINQIFRHEYGHYVYNKLISNEQDIRWKVKVSASGTKEYWEKNVSKYSSTNEQELFAESFSAYTSKKYAQSKNKLPKVIEKFMEDAIGKRGK